MFMQRTAIAMAISGVLLPLPFASTSASAFEASDAVDAIRISANVVQDLISRGYRAAPALMLGLGLLAVMPLMAIAAPIFSRPRRTPESTRRYKVSASEDVADDITGDEAERPAHAFLEVVGGSETRFAILRDMLRIGREDDNDIRIPSTAVHRYHAAIHREQLDDWYITDLSGTDGNGIRVNGQRCSDARLSDGDVIELGPGRLRFRAGLV